MDSQSRALLPDELKQIFSHKSAFFFSHLSRFWQVRSISTWSLTHLGPFWEAVQSIFCVKMGSLFWGRGKPSAVVIICKTENYATSSWWKYFLSVLWNILWFTYANPKMSVVWLWLFPHLRGLWENAQLLTPCLRSFSSSFFSSGSGDSSCTLIPLFRPGSVHSG